MVCFWVTFCVVLDYTVDVSPVWFVAIFLLTFFFLPSFSLAVPHTLPMSAYFRCSCCSFSKATDSFEVYGQVGTCVRKLWYTVVYHVEVIRKGEVFKLFLPYLTLSNINFFLPSFEC